jgi:4-hydroxy-tetrahydrodipicolinate synthase
MAKSAALGANNTEEAIHFTKHAKEAGADAALVVAPYYNKPTPEGIYQHYKAINDAVDIPIIIYNIPGRSVINIADDNLARLAKLPNIVGVKDATGDLARVSTLRAKAGKDFIQLSGEDMTMVPFNAAGGTGCISVVSNIAPRACADIQAATLAGDFRKALELHDKLVELITAMFCETSPGPVKHAASLMGLSGPELRLPLVQASDDSKAKVKKAMQGLGLVK